MRRDLLRLPILALIVGLLAGCSTNDGSLKIKAKVGVENINDLIYSARNLRALLWDDPHRPKYHHMPPEGFFNDANGALFWKGRYHQFYLGRTPIPHRDKPGEQRWVAVWDHVSSSDLVHWIYHPPAINPSMDGSTPQGIYSGGAIKNAPKPTLIYHVPGQGTCISIAQDDELITWEELPQNPVIKLHKEGDEFIVFDPAGWYENGKYYALIGNKNKRPGYEGDCTSLFTSTDMINWSYQGPFYKSNRAWTLEAEDAACPDFYPIGDRHMLLMHDHRPYRNVTHYYLGTYKDEHFFPEQHGRMSWLGGQLSGPESLIDDKGRNIFFGWLAESRTGGESLWGYDTEVSSGKNDQYAWASVISLPRVMSLKRDGVLGIDPVPELEILRFNARQHNQIKVAEGAQVTLDDMSGDVMELFVEIDPGTAKEIGVKIRCAPDNSEETSIIYSPSENTLRINFEKSTILDNVRYQGFYTEAAAGEENAKEQVAPLKLKKGETLQLRIFLDRSVVEVFANGVQCITQRIYPSKAESKEIRLFARGGDGVGLVVKAWDMEQTMPW